MSQPITLVYRGSGADLTFRSAGARRHALRGVPFEVDGATATILLSDPAVERFVPEQIIPTIEVSVPASLEEMTAAELRVLADKLGLKPKARDTNAAVIAAIRASERLPDTQLPVAPEVASVAAPDVLGDEDEAPASDPTPRPGSITLDDIPASARIQQ